MNGSSRALQRALAAVFDSWDTSIDWKSHPSPQIKALYDVIYAYKERHNTLSTISSTANDELRATHETHVRNSQDLSREVFFLELLSRLSPMLNEAQVDLWLRTYLQPAVDSAGFGLVYVNQARAFINSLTLQIFPTPDPDLSKRRHVIAEMVMQSILEVYIGGSKDAYAKIGVSVSDTERDSQTHAERVRFIERNAGALLREWGLKHPEPFFTLLHRFYADPRSRFKVLDLAAKVVSSTVSQVQKILDTPFFLDLLRSLLLDRSETLLGSCLSILLMAAGKVCHKISSYLPEILAIFSRLLLWKEYASESSTKLVEGVSWKVAESDQTASIMQTQIYADGSFNMSYIATLLYGLFPSNFISYCKSPGDYHLSNPPSHLASESAKIRDVISRGEDILSAFEAKSSKIMSRLMLHPNMLSGITVSQELKTPIKWILDKNKDQDVGEVEVLLECFALNPNLIFSIPDDIMLPHHLLQKIQSESNIALDGAGIEFSKKSTIKSGSRSVSNHEGEHTQVLKNPVEMSSGSNIPHHWLNIDRRVSIVPTKLVLEPHKETQAPAATHLQLDTGGIRFKAVDFAGTGANKNLRSPTSDVAFLESKVQEPSEPRPKNVLAELYTTHEKLFTSSAAAASNKTTVNIESASGTAKNFQRSASLASDVLSKQLQNEKLQDEDNRESFEENKEPSPAGSALDFYQRELLLMKNELEFSSYLKHLNKMNYLKLKIKYNKLKKDHTVYEQKVHFKQPVDHAGSYDSLVESMKELQITTQQSLARKDAEIKGWESEMQTMQEEIGELRSKHDMLQSDMENKESAIGRLQTEANTKSEQIGELQKQLKLAERAHVPPASRPQEEPNDTFNDTPSIFLKEQEKENVSLQMQLSALQNHNGELLNQLDAMKSELEEQHKATATEVQNKTAELKDMFLSRETRYEQKLKELSSVKSKYELVLEEQSFKIAQLSRAKPIEIPGVTQNAQRAKTPLGLASVQFPADPRDYAQERSGSYFMSGAREGIGGIDSPGSARSEGSSSSSAIASSSHDAHVRDFRGLEQSRLHSTSSIPIVRGRGGYQKRSRKHN